jgi:hypothetical protein
MKTTITYSIIANSNLDLLPEMRFLYSGFLNKQSYLSFGEAGGRNNGANSSVVTTLKKIAKVSCKWMSTLNIFY